MLNLVFVNMEIMPRYVLLNSTGHNFITEFINN